MSIPADPDRWALAIVQQWLREQGFENALAALEQESGLKVRQEVQRGSQLLQLVYDHIDALAAASLDDAAVARRQLEEELLAGGNPSGPGDCPSRLKLSLEGLHAASNVIAVECLPEGQLAVSGSSDGSVRLFSYAAEAAGGGERLLCTAAAGASGVLCLALQPAVQQADSQSSGAAESGSSNSSSGKGPVVAAGLMDGGVVVLDAGSGEVLARAKPHRKYAVAAKWAPDGRHLVTASWDCSFAVHRLQRAAQQGEEAASGDAAGSSGSGWQLVTIHSEQTTNKVNSIAFLPPLPPPANHSAHGGDAAAAWPSSGDATAEGLDSSSSSGSTFLVAVQGSNYLRELSIAAPPEPGSTGSGDADAAGGGGQADAAGAAGTAGEAGTPAGSASGPAAVVREVRRINLNAAGDDHVSFSPVHLAASPCARLLLVSADNGRLLVYERAGWTQVRSIIGLPTEQFHQFAACWHRSGAYVMAAAAHGGLCIFHVGSARLVQTMPAHSKNLRGLAYDPAHNLLLTCSFDRTVKVWEAAGEA